MQTSGWHIIGCPECDAPASVAPRTPAGSVPHPDDVVFVTCSAGHWLLMPHSMLADSRTWR